jgi:hypothetical protein
MESGAKNYTIRVGAKKRALGAAIGIPPPET